MDIVKSYAPTFPGYWLQDRIPPGALIRPFRRFSVLIDFQEGAVKEEVESMPTIIRRSFPTVMETRREILVATSWQVHSNIWTPPTDVYETEKNLVIKVEVAGMRDDDFELGVEDQFLTITGNRPDLHERCAYHQMEIRSGRFEIVIGLPAMVDVEMATAEYKDGFLMVIFPKIRTKQNEVE